MYFFSSKVQPTINVFLQLRFQLYKGLRDVFSYLKRSINSTNFKGNHTCMNSTQYPLKR